MHFNGRPLALIRKFRRMSVNALSEKSGVCPDTIKKLEAGKGNPQYYTLEHLSNTLEVPIDVLCGRNLDNYIIVGNGNEKQIVYCDMKNNSATVRLAYYLQILQSQELQQHI